MADKGLTLEALAKAVTDAGLHVTKQGVAGYLKDPGRRKRKKIPGDFLAAVCRSQEVRTAWLLLGCEPKYGRDCDGPDPFANGVAFAVDALSDVAAELRAKHAPKSRFRRPPPGDDAGNGASSPPEGPDGGPDDSG